MAGTTLDIRRPARNLRGWGIAAVFVGIAALAWVATVEGMDGRGMSSRFDPGAAASFLLLWVAMMAAMMFPSAWPVIRVYALVAGSRSAAGRSQNGRVAAFAGGYLLAWTAVGVVAYGLLAGLSATSVADWSNDRVAAWIVAPAAALAAVYQWTPLKRVCLRHCRSPLGFLLGTWRNGIGGALRSGLSHGSYCIGCCWMLMVTVLAVGVMSTSWMAIAAAAIAIEKLDLLPRRVASGAVGLGFAALAVLALVDPSLLPGFGAPGMSAGRGM